MRPLFIVLTCLLTGSAIADFRVPNVHCYTQADTGELARETRIGQMSFDALLKRRIQEGRCWQHGNGHTGIATTYPLQECVAGRSC